MSSAKTQKQIKETSKHLVLYLVTLIIAFPLIWMLLSSFKPFSEIYQVPPTMWPHDATIKNYIDLFRMTNFGRYFWNSTVVAFISTTLSVIISVLGGYSLARYRFRWNQTFGRLVLLAYIFPPILMVIPIYSLIIKLHLADTLTSLVIAYITFTLPFTLWLIKAFFDAIPRDFEEAAMVDGASPFQAFLRVAVPMALPGIISTSIFAFVDAWNDYLYALVFISSDANKTLPAGVQSLVGHTAIYSWGMLMAAAVLITVPAVIFFILTQRHLVAGEGEGGLKG